jgi:hypothetical protein
VVSAPVAQLDRASDYGSEGRRFESFRAREVCDGTRGVGRQRSRRVSSGPETALRTGDAPVAELVDALDSGSSGRKLVEVRVLSGALVRDARDGSTAQVLKLVDRPD